METEKTRENATHEPAFGHGEGDEERARLDYGARLAALDTFYAPLYRQVAAWLDVAPHARILDAGCGAGGMASVLAGAIGGTGQLTALDIAPAHLARTRDLLTGACPDTPARYVEGSVDALPFADATFDLIWCSHVAHGQPDQLASARELRRVLAPAGRLALREDFPASLHLLPFDAGSGRPGLLQRIAALQADAFTAWRDALPGAVRYPSGWMQLLRDAGFATVTARTFVFELTAPFTQDQHTYLAHLLHSWRTAEFLRRGLNDEDRAALDLLTDPDGADYALGRDTCYVVHATTVYVGEAGDSQTVPERATHSAGGSLDQPGVRRSRTRSARYL
jgi:ubiquinone/menaquinone biosynthesis C-methylase UbiE